MLSFSKFQWEQNLSIPPTGRRTGRLKKKKKYRILVEVLNGYHHPIKYTCSVLK